MLLVVLYLPLLLLCSASFAKAGRRFNVNTIFRGSNQAKSTVIPAAIATAVSPLLLLALSTSKLDVSPLNKKDIHVLGPFFQGWLLRVIDHDQSLSAICIVGSFSARNQAQYTEHYVFCAIDSPNMNDHAEMLVNPLEVSIGKVSHGHNNLDINWVSEDVRFTFNDSQCIGQFTFPGKFSIQFNATKRMQWAPRNRRFSFGGPEGWLGLASVLMPCHYFVHSVGSRCSYQIRSLNPALRAPSYLNRLVSRFSGFSPFGHTNKQVGTTPAATLAGQGYAHIEGNHGTAFPEGWIWSQGIAVNNTASYSLALGKFAIAGMTPTNCILYLRRASGDTVVVRTTDFDRVYYTTNATDGSIALNAISVLKRFRIHMTIQPQGNAARAFGVKVQVPTIEGFTKDPGCKETYTALARIQYIDTSVSNPKIEEYSFPLSALEYGGSFLQKLSS